MSNRLQVLVPQELDMRIRKAAERTRISKGEWVRRALERALEEQTPVADAVAKLQSLEGPTGDIGQILEEIESGRR